MLSRARLRYIAKVIKKVAKSDKPSYHVQFYDGIMDFYLHAHPKFKGQEMKRFLTHEDVKVLQLGEPCEPTPKRHKKVSERKQAMVLVATEPCSPIVEMDNEQG